jgi:hypothetical protein
VIVDGYAEQSNYIDHLASIWRALPDGVRGDFRTPDPDLVPYCKAKGIDAALSSRFAPSDDRWLMVASGRELMRHRGRRHILVEHGAGQTYVDAPAAVYGYAGGCDRGTVGLFVCPSQRVADANLAAYPLARAVVAGSPRLDQWHVPGWRRHPSSPLRIVISTHWNGGPCQESLSAWPEYRRAYSDFARQHTQVYKHAHPKWADHVRRDLPDIPFIDTFDEVLDTADIYICDNSSTQYETAALGIPNVVINSAEYRRDVQHGLRFWSHIPGPECNSPEQLARVVRSVESNYDGWRDYGRRVASDVYDGLLDGHATERAVGAILALDAEARVPVP